MKTEIEEQAEESTNNFRKDILRSKHGRLKLEALDSVSLIMGAGFAGLGRLTNSDLLPLVPVGIGIMTNMTGWFTPRGLFGWAKYGLGAGLVYTDKIHAHWPEIINYTSKIIYPLVERFN